MNEFVFRFNRRRSRSRGMVFYRVLELAVGHHPVRYKDLITAPAPQGRTADAAGELEAPAELGAPSSEPSVESRWPAFRQLNGYPSPPVASRW